jgi:hypothetical protein
MKKTVEVQWNSDLLFILLVSLIVLEVGFGEQELENGTVERSLFTASLDLFFHLSS